MGQVDGTNIDHVMRYHAPDQDQIAHMEEVRKACLNLGNVILENVPQCADRTTALRKLRELKMDANAAIALNGMI